MIRFGPAGASDSFKEQGYKHTVQAPAWLAALGLNAFEYSGGHGVRISEETAAAIGAQAEAHGIAISFHAPYFINLAEAEETQLEKSFRWLYESAQAVCAMGGERVIFHAGSPKKLARGEAMLRACRALERALEHLGPLRATLCPETMGRAGQLGTVDEVIQLCRVAPNVLPAIDFAHLHALARLTGPDDFRRIIDPMIDALGLERMRRFHAHFSHIEYTNAGEKRHRNFDDEGFGPDFAPLAQVLCEYGLKPTIICESSGHQAEDALAMKTWYEEVSRCFTN